MIRAGLACLLLAGCLNPNNPTCTGDSDCARFAGGWCHCIDGLCFKFDCPARDASTPEIDECPPDHPGGAADGCCPALLAARETDPDCAIAAKVTLGAQVLPPAADEAGRLYIVHGGGESWALLPLAADLTAGSSVALPEANAAVSQPVVLADGTVAVATPAALHVYDPAAESAAVRFDAAASGGLASAPVPLSDGALLLVSAAGALLTSPASGPPLPNDVGLPAAASAEIAVSADDRFVFAVLSGRLYVIDRPKAVVVYESAEGVVGAPALGAAGAAYVVAAGGEVGGVVRTGVTWTPLVTQAVGTAPLSPVVGAGEVVIVASSAEKRVTAVQYVGEAPTVLWTAGGLADVPSTPPLVGGDTVWVGLGNGQLVALTAVGSDATARWSYQLDGAALGAPLAFSEGGVLHLTSGGIARVQTIETTTDPWPSWRRDRRAAARAVD